MRQNNSLFLPVVAALLVLGSVALAEGPKVVRHDAEPVETEACLNLLRDLSEINEAESRLAAVKKAWNERYTATIAQIRSRVNAAPDAKVDFDPGAKDRKPQIVVTPKE